MWESTRPGRTAKSPKSVTGTKGGISLRETTPTICSPSTSMAKAPIFPGSTTCDDVKACTAITDLVPCEEKQMDSHQTTAGLPGDQSLEAVRFRRDIQLS